MTETLFQTSTLWQRTLGATREDDHGERERLRLSYLATRRNAAILLNELSHTTPAFTVHDITHVDALWETASMICGTSIILTPAEAYVLGCSFIFHDAAMGAAAYKKDIPEVIGRAKWADLLSSFFVDKTGEWPTKNQLDSPPADLANSCLAHAIREVHAAQAARLVDQDWDTSAGNKVFLIEDLQLRESYGTLIGELAASHWWPVENLHSRFMRARGSLSCQPPDWIVDPLKLACILRLADAAQVDSRRAPTFLFALRDPNGLSRHHWRFQEHMARPQLIGDRLRYTSWRHFESTDADAWWLALDYLRLVDLELKAVDALLHDLDKPLLEARAVAGVDSPERFAELFPVKGWRPVDARIKISDVPMLVEKLGGEQLYGREPEIAIRELLQNAQDAVLARKSLDQSFTDETISISLRQQDNVWTFEIVDHGVGMDESILTSALLDFGRPGWTTEAARNGLTGLTEGGFRPRGRFGIGFFSVFMLGDHVEVLTRRFDSAQSDARRLQFKGVQQRPILTSVAPSERVGPGTRIRVTLNVSPYDDNGIFARTIDETLNELIQRLAPERAVPIRIAEADAIDPIMVHKTDLADSNAPQVFDILFPPLKTGGNIAETQRQFLRDEFVKRATEVTDSTGRRIGLGTLGMDLYYAGPRDLDGRIIVNGFRSDSHFFFTGYMEGYPNRASRDQADLTASKNELQGWIASQEVRLRELGLLHQSAHLESARILYLANNTLPEDHYVAASSEGLLVAREIIEWAHARKEVMFVKGWPLSLTTRPPIVRHSPTGATVQLPQNWLYAGPSLIQPIFDRVLGRARDPQVEFARYERVVTWQKAWWQVSDYVEGFVLKLLCSGWSCQIGDILAPVAERNWNDYAEIKVAGYGTEQVPIWRLTRPRSMT